MPSAYTSSGSWNNFDRIKALKLQLDEKLSRARAEGRAAEARAVEKELLELRALKDAPNVSFEERGLIANLFAEEESSAAEVAAKTSEAQSIDRGNACLKIIDDCPKFRITVKNALPCKDVKIKTIKITCTDASIPDSLKPDWLKDSSIISPEVQSLVTTLGEVEFNNQKNGFTLNVKQADLDGNLTGDSKVKGDCTIYEVIGSFKKKFSHALCVPSNDGEEVVKAISNELDKLEAEQKAIDPVNTFVVSARKIEVIEGI